MTPRDEATSAQIKAARPDASTWLAANAGSGKTRVLTDRVARLLLEGVEPQHILCLTYTKAAASEMQNRLFKRLGEWAMRDTDALRQSLQELGIEGEIPAERLREARTLFARAIETPGGLKIQTIHSFCASLLRRFPLEAQVSPGFTEIEDRAADLLRSEIVDTMADGPDAALVSGLATHYTGEDFDNLTRAIVQHRAGFSKPMLLADLEALFGLPADYDPAVAVSTVIDPSVGKWLPEAIGILSGLSSTMVKMGEALSGINTQDPSASDLETLKSLFLYRKDGKYLPAAKTGSIPTKKGMEAFGPLLLPFHDLMDRTAQAHEFELGFMAARKSHALHQFAAQFLRHYDTQKLLRGWLDFDDLIDKARNLLTNPAVAAWVLFRIDGGIDHILVDEAQDTSPTQWDVIRKLAAEFTSGQGAREDVQRTIFVVGDKKQSIYSFQGADPREFDRMEAEFRDKITGAGEVFQSETLRYSFRSSDAVLKVVDQAFVDMADAGFADNATHMAFKSQLPGRVDLWPLVEKRDDDDDREWFEPLDRKSEKHHNVVLAQRIAGQINQMIDSGQTIPDDTLIPKQTVQRPVRAGDFLILVQRRSDLFAEIIRACKIHELPIAGADRLKVGGELAVRDLAALLSFLAVPEDSLSLASALKSPLFGWSEQQVFDLAHRRTQEHLWQALRDRAEEFPETLSVLRDLRANTDFLRPYDLIERILTRHKGRRKLLARLGPEVEDGINALLSQALAYERNAVPSLTGFLVWMETDDLEIKRQVDSASDQIRVMTVHGAKGLEAPIVILPDTGRRTVKIDDQILSISGSPVLKTAAEDMPSPMSARVQEMKETQAQERQRLLYVALTRAEKWLIVAAAGDLPNGSDSWYQTIQKSMGDLGAETVAFQDQVIQRLSHSDWDALPISDENISQPQLPSVDPVFHQQAPMPPDSLRTISPSDLGGEKALGGPEATGRDEEAAKAYGTLVHKYLEHLAATPQQEWTNLSKVLLAEDSADQHEAWKEASAVLQSDHLQFLFGKNSLAEVPVSAGFGPDRLYGVIDRLVLTDTRVLAVDFKSNRIIPKQPEACPTGILRQMAAYHAALKQIYPDREIQTAILWTASQQMMPLSHDIVSASLENTPYLDAATEAT